MKKLELNQMENLEGGCNSTDAQAQIAILGAVGSGFFGVGGGLLYTLVGIYATGGGKHCI